MTKELKLSKREVESLGLAANGLRNQQIADALELSDSSVKQHLRRARIKLGASTLNEAIRIYSRQQQLIEIRNELISRIKKSKMEETIRAFILQETDAESIDELSFDDKTLEIWNYIDKVIGQLEDD